MDDICDNIYLFGNCSVEASFHGLMRREGVVGAQPPAWCAQQKAPGPREQQPPREAKSVRPVSCTF